MKGVGMNHKKFSIDEMVIESRALLHAVMNAVANQRDPAIIATALSWVLIHNAKKHGMGKKIFIEAMKESWDRHDAATVFYRVN